jgi:protein-tyrosine phosphatase
MGGRFRICFVCLGNIVRSPLAEKMFLHLAEQAGLDEKFQVDSAGTASWHVGEAPDGRMRRVAAAHGLRYGGRSRQFVRSDFDRFDLIVAMDQENRSDLYAMARSPEQRQKVRLLREFDPQGGSDQAVPDPYYGTIHDFDETYRIVERSARGLLQALIREHALAGDQEAPDQPFQGNRAAGDQPSV